MLLYETLEKFGLSSRESRVYLACLELGKANCQAIAKKAGLPRSTTYSVLEGLAKINLVFTYEKQKIRQYFAEDPQKVVNLSEESTQAIKSIFPELKSLYKTAKGRPRIKYYENLSAIKEMYSDILRQKGLKEYLIIASESAWLHMDEKWFAEFKKRRAAAKIKTRLILEDSPEARQRQEEAGKTFSEVKILPKDFIYEMGSGVYIFREKVIFLEYKKDLIAVEVQSKGIANMQRMMFEMVWKELDDKKMKARSEDHAV